MNCRRHGQPQVDVIGAEVAEVAETVRMDEVVEDVTPSAVVDIFEPCAAGRSKATPASIKRGNSPIPDFRNGAIGV